MLRFPKQHLMTASLTHTHTHSLLADTVQYISVPKSHPSFLLIFFILFCCSSLFKLRLLGCVCAEKCDSPGATLFYLLCSKLPWKTWLILKCKEGLYLKKKNMPTKTKRLIRFLMCVYILPPAGHWLSVLQTSRPEMSGKFKVLHLHVDVSKGKPAQFEICYDHRVNMCDLLTETTVFGISKIYSLEPSRWPSVGDCISVLSIISK